MIERGQRVADYEPTGLTARVIANMKALRAQRGWSAQALADRLPVDMLFGRAVIANLETGRRRDISLEEIAALAAVFGYANPWDLTAPIVPPCPRCAGEPPEGFTCQLCGAPVGVKGVVDDFETG
jgi:transcriptional regulator with XRE-family HTH domain